MKVNHTYLLIALIFLASVFLRVDNLLWETYGYGEMEIKEVVDSYLKGNFVNNYYLFDTPPLGKYLFTVSAMLFGSTEFGLRIVSAVFGILTLGAAYFLTRKLYDTKLAILATTLTGFSLIHIQFSRYTQFETILSFLYVLIIYFLWSMTENKNRYDFLFLGAALALALSVKFTSVIMLVVAAAYFVYTKHIKLSIKPSFSLSIQNNILKALLVTIVLFIALWPFGLQRLHAEANITVDYGDVPRSQIVQADVPIMVMSFFRRIFASVGDAVPHSLATGTPVINYILLYLTKEFLLIIPMIIAGVYMMIKKPVKNDKIVAFTVIIFVLLLSLQRTNISYRHMAPIIPFLSIVAARWIYSIKQEWQMKLIALIAVLFFAAALLAGPSYALSFNPLKSVVGIEDSELRFSEGMQQAIYHVKTNCNNVFTNNYYKLMGVQYYANFVVDPQQKTDCALKGAADMGVGDYTEQNKCTIEKEIEKNNITLIEIYRCP